MDFGTVMIVIAVLGVIVAAISFSGERPHIQRPAPGRTGSLTMDGDDRRPAPSAPSAPEAQEEIRQMLEAKSARRQARGETALDVDAELATLTRSAGPDDALRDEVRQLVVARNERRRRQGREPLNVEAEVERQLRDLGT